MNHRAYEKSLKSSRKFGKIKQDDEFLCEEENENQ